MLPFLILHKTPEMVKSEALEFFEAKILPATAATIFSFWTGLELTLSSHQLSYPKRKTDRSEGIEGKCFTSDLLTYLHSLSYMCLYDMVDTSLLEGGTRRGPSKEQKTFEMHAIHDMAKRKDVSFKRIICQGRFTLMQRKCE
jgi:hypothetical protein